MFKLRKSQKKAIPCEGEIVSGMNALQLQPGTILKVLRGSVSNTGDIIVRTDDRAHPFRTLMTTVDNGAPQVGGKWGTSLSDYRFAIMYGYKIERDFPEYLKALELESEEVKV